MVSITITMPTVIALIIKIGILMVSTMPSLNEVILLSGMATTKKDNFLEDIVLGRYKSIEYDGFGLPHPSKKAALGL